MNDNPILRPVEMLKDGQETASMFLDGNRTRIFSFSRDALTQLSYQFDNQSTAAHPKVLAHGQYDGQEARWESISCPMVRGLNALAVSRFTDNPNSTARRKCLHTAMNAPDGNRTHISRISSGILSQLNCGTVREAAHVCATSRMRF